MFIKQNFINEVKTKGEKENQNFLSDDNGNLDYENIRLTAQIRFSS